MWNWRARFFATTRKKTDFSSITPARPDRRITDFLNAYLKDVLTAPVKMPANSFILDRSGLARVLSLPPNEDHFNSDIVDSYRVRQGVLHNPKNDRRTTQGSFHIVEGGLPIPADKIAVPKAAFAALLRAALTPPKSLMTLPFTAAQEQKACLWLSLLMRPLVCPAAGAITASKSMETRFFAPGSLVSNLDFVESIFGNAGDPYLPECDAALDIDHWTGHTGCVILAPHLTTLTKHDVGLPSYDAATERQRRDGMCWKKENELYNGGGAFKITCRDARGVMVTIIADNYYGYCKKEIKTQISFAANLSGLAEEEHSGGAIAFPSYVLGREFHPDSVTIGQNNRTFEDALRLLGDHAVLKARRPRRRSALPHRFVRSREHAHQCAPTVGDLHHSRTSKQNKIIAVSFVHLSVGLQGSDGETDRRALLASHRLSRRRHALPQTLDGVGRRQIGNFKIDRELHAARAGVRAGLPQRHRGSGRHFSKWISAAAIARRRGKAHRASRPLLSPERSLGSVIKLFTPAPEYTEAHNEWLRGLPQTIRQLVFTVKRYYKPEWGDNWAEHFSVDRINGFLGHELKYDEHRLVANYLRVGHDGTRQRLARLQGADRISIPRTRCRWKTTSPRPPWCPRNRFRTSPVLIRTRA